MFFSHNFVDKRFTLAQQQAPDENKDSTAYRGLLESPHISPIVPISAPSRVISANVTGSPGLSPLMSGSPSFGSSYYITPSSYGGQYSPSYQEIPSQVYYTPSSVNMSLRNRVGTVISVLL